MTKRKPRQLSAKRAADDFADYDMEITRWSWGYHFGINHRKAEIDGFSESRHIRIDGRIIGDVGAKYPAANVTLIPDDAYNLDQRLGKVFHSHVGVLDAHGGLLHGIFSIPADAVGPVLTVLAAGQFRYLLMRGARLFRRSARVWSYSLETWVDPDDLPSRTT